MHFVRLLLCVSVWLEVLTATAQVRIAWPLPNAVFQRDVAGKATVRLVVCEVGATPLRAVQVRFAPLGLHGERTSDADPTRSVVETWETAVITAGAGTKRVECQVEAIPGGLYAVQVRANDSLSREVVMGVGEIFAIAGQSNASGAVNCDEVPTRYPRFVQFFNVKTACPEHDPGGRAFPGGSNACSGPTKEFRFYWGALGDLFAERLGVPVVFHQTAYGGSQVDDWERSAQGLTTRFGPVVPYGSLQTLLAGTAQTTGLRAVLWHQGESDHRTNGYDAALNRVIGQTWADAGFNVPWVVARASYNDSTTSPALVRQQVRVIGYATHANQDPTAPVKPYGDPFPGPFGRWGVFTGPFTDSLGAAARCDNVHFGKEGQALVARLWFEALTRPYTVPGVGENGNFLSNSLPLLPRLAPTATGTTCAGADTPLVTQVSPLADERTPSVSPNPTTGRATMRWFLTGPGPIQVQVVNALGAVLQTWQHDGRAGENELQLDVTALPTAVYGLRLSGAGLHPKTTRVLKTDR